MFDAFTVTEVASKLDKSTDVTCIAAHSNSPKVYIGSKSGHLLSLSEIHDGKRGYGLTMCRSFERKSVVSLQVVSNCDLILSLSDGQVTAHDLSEPFSVITTISDVKPIITFESRYSEGSGLLYVAVAARKRFILYKWVLNDFHQVSFDISPAYFAETPRYIVWCTSMMAFVIQNDYYYISLSHIMEDVYKANCIFDTGSKTDNPLIIDIADRSLVAFCRDNLVFFVNYVGVVSDNPEIKLSEVPLQIVYCAPFLVSLLSKGKVEIRTIRPSLHIQTLQLHRACYISKGPCGTVYMANSSIVWLLDSRTQMKANIERLVLEKHYELAIQMATHCQGIGDSALAAIKRKAAFSLFVQKRFEEWLELHADVETDVMVVIAHFPRLLDGNFRESLESLLEETTPANFTETDYHSGYLALAPYLASVRMKHAKALADLKKLNLKSEKNELIYYQNVLQVVDTTLLKCYLETNQSLIVPLLRLPDNMCILKDAEESLRKYDKYYELYLLYEKKALHHKALTLLKEQARNLNTLLNGSRLTVEYLQRLDNSNLDVIFAYAPWILQNNFEEGLSIFTQDECDLQKLDRDRVVQFLISECVQAIIPYLEYLIYECSETRAKFHNMLGEYYIAKVKSLMQDYISVVRDDHDFVPAGEERGELGEYRRKLKIFLFSSVNYNAEKLLVQLLHDSLFEERAILLGRLKKHDQALAIYTNILNDYEAAEEYCCLYYDRFDEQNSKIFMVALRMYLHPPDASIVGFLQRGFYRNEPNQSEAIKLLKKHANAIDTVDAISMLPADFSLKKLWSALEAIMQATHERRISVLMHKSFYEAALKACGLRRDEIHRMKITVGYDLECAYCGKKVSTSAFTLYPNGRIEHLFCYQRQSERKPE